MRYLAAVVTAAVLAFPSAALADSPHFIGEQTCSKPASFTLTCTGKAAGLGNAPTGAFLTASGVAEKVQCRNPAGHIAPGHAATETNVVGPTEQIAPHNGQITYSVSLSPPPTPTSEEAGCPNPKWSVEVLSVTYENVVLHIQQNGEDILTFDFGTI